MKKVRVAVVGAGQFGRNHVRVARESERADLAAVVDIDPARASDAAGGCLALADYRDLRGSVDAAIVAVPTSLHADIGCELMQSGIDVLVEKPLAAGLDGADRLIETARDCGRILQVGHLERYNPAILALERVITRPLFFEIHRMNLFSPRGLDVDIVLDLMIHDLDIVLSMLSMAGAGELEEIRAAGISILSEKVDIGNVRLQFRGGCVANLSASRVSTERVRKLRLFQPHEYISLDYGKQTAVQFRVDADRRISFAELPVAKGEPLALQFDAFLTSVETRAEPKLNGAAARRTLEVALAILDKMREHSQVVEQSLLTGWTP
jgi:predicted dehydrogenase